MIKIITISILAVLAIIGCQTATQNESNKNEMVKYNLIEPGNGIYVITQKDVTKENTKNKSFEAVYYENELVTKIERYNNLGNLSDSLSVAAITKFEYNSDNKVKYLKYFDKNGNNSEDEIFGYWSVEYIYDNLGRVRMEIYRDAESKFLEVPRDNSGNIAKLNFLSPVLTYEYIDNKLKIKALDHNFNLLKEVLGDKPCVPFIDCGESD